MLRVGLTGGIASGKSVVAEMLRKRGYQVLDADQLGHQMIEPDGPAYGDLLGEFGTGILDRHLRVDRSKLAAIVFADPRKRARLNQTLHPRILERVKQWFAECERVGRAQLAFLEAALLVEAGYGEALDSLVVCWCRPEQQIERLLARGLSNEQAEQRLAAQMDVHQKRRAADHVIDCSGSIAQTEQQLDELIRKLMRAARSRNNS